jgi:hypothetical protein
MAKKKKKIKPTCYYCTYFLSATVKRGEEGKIIKKCKPGQQVSGSDTACIQFEASNYFWCDLHKERMSTAICTEKSKKRIRGCNKKCLQGQMIKSIMEVSHESLFPAETTGPLGHLYLDRHINGDSQGQKIQPFRRITGFTDRKRRSDFGKPRGSRGSRSKPAAPPD